MEWMNRGEQRQGQPAGQASTAAPQPGGKQKVNLKNLKTWKVAQVALLFSVTILVVAVVWFVALSGGQKESSYVDKTKLQAVFLNGGQVYFGNIDDLNNRFLSMSNIYYLRVNQQVQPNQSTNTNNDISLVKLGCELHGPQDRMVINREQIIFWENLKDDGQVANAVKQYREQNPGEQNCDQQGAGTTTNQNATTDDAGNLGDDTDTTNSNTNTGTGTQR